MAESLRQLASLNKSNVTVKVYPDGGHGIEDPSTHLVQKQLLENLVEFIDHLAPSNPRE